MIVLLPDADEFDIAVVVNRFERFDDNDCKNCSLCRCIRSSNATKFVSKYTGTGLSWYELFFPKKINNLINIYIQNQFMF